MTTIEARATSTAKRATRSTSFKPEKSKAKSRNAVAQNAVIELATTKILAPAPVAKRDQVLKLLSRREGASIAEIMEASGWQQHSVRGFLAGTVKKKLGLDLTSTKSEGEDRRYRVATRRGR